MTRRSAAEPFLRLKESTQRSTRSLERAHLPRIVRTGASPSSHVGEGDAPMAAATEGQFGSHCQARPEFGESVKARQNGLC